MEFALDCGSDQVEALAVVECLDRILVGPARLDALRRLNQQHPDDVVRLTAAQALTRCV
jgi:2-keto-3-deoxy-L-rhamnonate aldolase RhmA